MTEDERKALRVIEGGIELLRNAIIKGDSLKELEFRARALLAEVRGIANGNAKMVATRSGAYSGTMT